jgi:hypothetical protein
MNKRLLCAASVIVLLAACAGMGHGTRSPRATSVDVVEGHLTIDQEPIIVRRGESPVLIWRLPAHQGYIFPDDAIVFNDASRGGFDCHVTGDREQVQCVDKAAPGRHKYTIKAQSGDKTLEPLDPFVYNL